MKADWLDLPGTSKAVVPRKKRFTRTEKREALAQSLRQLTVQQRLWLKAWVKNGFSSQKARRELSVAGIEMPKHYTISRWQHNPNYLKARELYEAMVYDADGPSKATILLRVNKIAEYNVEEVKEMHQGEPTGRMVMRDASIALKASEMQMKEKKMLSDEAGGAREGPQLIVQVIQAGPSQVNVGPKHVTVRPAADDVEDAEILP